MRCASLKNRTHTQVPSTVSFCGFDQHALPLVFSISTYSSVVAHRTPQWPSAQPVAVVNGFIPPLCIRNAEPPNAPLIGKPFWTQLIPSALGSCAAWMWPKASLAYMSPAAASVTCYLCGIPSRMLWSWKPKCTSMQLYGIGASLNRLLMGAIFKIKMQSCRPLGVLRFISQMAIELENSLSPLFLHLFKRCYG